MGTSDNGANLSMSSLLGTLRGYWFRVILSAWGYGRCPYVVEHAEILRKGISMSGTHFKILQRNKADRKSWELYDFTDMWDIKLKATREQNKQLNKNAQTQTTV